MTHARMAGAAACLVALLGSAPLCRGGNEDTNEVSDLLAAAGRYVVGYATVFSDLVAEETYDQTQDMEFHLPGQPMRRRTRADIVFVAIPGPLAWACFRDVYEVDGKDVRDRDARLEKLFVENQMSAIEEATALRSESARFNIGIARTVNEPTLPLMFLRPENQSRFAFRVRGHPKIQDTRVAEVAFREASEPTLVVEDGRADLLSTGRLWIEPATGTVVRTELVLDSLRTTLQATITVEYEKAPDLDIWVPSRMRENYKGLHTIATYANYRRFRVQTMEAIGLPTQKRDKQP